MSISCFLFYFSERIIVVAEFMGQSLDELKSKLSHEEIINIALQIATALKFLHENDFTHRTLATDNILVDSYGRVKLFNYGMYYMTRSAAEVSFPLGYVYICSVFLGIYFNALYYILYKMANTDIQRNL